MSLEGERGQIIQEHPSIKLREKESLMEME